MIRVERNPGFWIDVASHPALTPHLLGLDPSSLGPIVQNPRCLPFASTHGGYLCAIQDAFGIVVEFHAMFTPEGWGREAHDLGREAVEHLFSGRCQLLTCLEMEHVPRSNPPRSFGFVQEGPWVDTEFGAARLWVLTRKAWAESKAHGRMN